MGKFIFGNDFSVQENTSSKNRHILNFRVMAVRDIKLSYDRVQLSKIVYFSRYSVLFNFDHIHRWDQCAVYILQSIVCLFNLEIY